jgi:hypothetical protein
MSAGGLTYVDVEAGETLREAMARAVIIPFCHEPRVGWVSPDGQFLGFAVDFGIKASASYVVFRDGEWRAVS